MNSRGLKSILCFAVLCLSACGDSRQNDIVYEDVTELSGLQFVHQNASDDTLALPPIMGSGVALFDFDGDADLDIYLVQGAADRAAPDEIWLNESEGGRMRFRRMPATPALESQYPGMGVAVEDVDLDGRLDVLVTSVGTNRLLLNKETGLVVSSAAEISNDSIWSASAVWLDANLDGWPDLFVTNVADYDGELACRSLTGRPDYCSADKYISKHDQLLLNEGVNADGDVTFEDVSHAWGVASLSAPSLGVRVADFNGDMWPDVYVASFGTDNALWISQKGESFTERSLASGAASSFLPGFRGSVGVDAVDLDRDGDLDIVVSHRLGESHQLYLNDGLGRFVASSITAGGLAEAHTGAGVVVVDANADGHDDLYVANGAFRLRQSQLDASDVQPLRETNTLLLGGSDESIEFDVWKQSSERLTPRPQVSRSVAAGDLDNDGDVDLLVTNNGAAAQVLRNVVNPEHWMGINPVSKATGLAAVGARVWMYQSRPLSSVDSVREVRRAHGFLSSSDPRLVMYRKFEQMVPVNIEILWPGGNRELFSVLPEARYHTLTEGAGRSIDPDDKTLGVHP